MHASTRVQSWIGTDRLLTWPGEQSGTTPQVPPLHHTKKMRAGELTSIIRRQRSRRTIPSDGSEGRPVNTPGPGTNVLYDRGRLGAAVGRAGLTHSRRVAGIQPATPA